MFIHLFLFSLNNPNPDKPEPKKKKLPRKHEGTRKHEKKIPRKDFVSSCFAAFALRRSVVVFLFSARKSINSMTNGPIRFIARPFVDNTIQGKLQSLYHFY